MRRFRPKTLLFLSVLMGLLVAGARPSLAVEDPAAAEGQAIGVLSTAPWDLEPIKEAKGTGAGDWEEAIDDFFGSKLVAPLETVLFFDFWTSQWLNRHVSPEVKCPQCGTKFKVLEPWPQSDAPEAVPCPKCAAEGKEDTGGKLQIIVGTRVPLVVLWLLVGAVFFTLRMGFISFRGFWHAIQLTRGRYDDPEETGEVSHFQALASALSATIGLGNIAGVAIAVSTGGPGAIFWMILAGLLGMSSKFAECTLSQIYRKVDPDGTVSGGPMHYLYQGLKEFKIAGIGLGSLGAVLAVIFAIFCMGGSFGGGCAFQVSQSQGTIREQMLQVWPDFDKYRQMTEVRRDSPGARDRAIQRIQAILARNHLTEEFSSDTTDADEVVEQLDKASLAAVDRQELQRSLTLWKLTQETPEELARIEAGLGWPARFFGEYLEWVYGLTMAALVGLVIIGGIRRIAATAEKIVPLMCCVYVATTTYILLVHYEQIPWAMQQIFVGAFTPGALAGGVLGVMVIGIQRAAFSNEAGIGSAAIAHAAAKTEEPIREGIVASLGPFIDTVVICTMTGLVMLITKAYNNPEYAQLIASKSGAALTSKAFAGVVSWFPWVLCVAVVLFAYSTMISWSYYGERCWSHLFGPKLSLAYKMLFLAFVVLGAVVTADNVLSFSDLMILSMAFPNIFGVALLSGKVRRALDDYWRRYKAGEMEPKHRGRTES